MELFSFKAFENWVTLSANGKSFLWIPKQAKLLLKIKKLRTRWANVKTKWWCSFGIKILWEYVKCVTHLKTIYWLILHPLSLQWNSVKPPIELLPKGNSISPLPFKKKKDFVNFAWNLLYISKHLFFFFSVMTRKNY